MVRHVRLFVGALLLTEGGLFAAVRLFTFIYVVGRQQYVNPRPSFVTYLPFMAGSLVVLTVLLWAGGQFRTAPDGAWPAAGIPARLVLITALLLNLAVVVRSLIGVTQSTHAGAEVLVAWSVGAAVSGVGVLGMLGCEWPRRAKRVPSVSN